MSDTEFMAVSGDRPAAAQNPINPKKQEGEFPSREIIHKSYMDEYKIIRDYIIHEDNLINQRLTWSLAGHGILGALLGFLWKDYTKDLLSAPATLLVITTFVGGIGMATSFANIASINAAHNALDCLARHWRERQSFYRNQIDHWACLPGVGGGGDDHNVSRGKQSAWIVAILFAASWLTIAALSLHLLTLPRVDHGNGASAPRGTAGAPQHPGR